MEHKPRMAFCIESIRNKAEVFFMNYVKQKKLKGNIGVFLGAFAPLHQGHLDIIMRAKNVMYIAWTINAFYGWYNWTKLYKEIK